MNVMHCRTLLAILLAASFFLSGAVDAQESSALYQATTIVTGTDMRQRPLGFNRCLREVLVKVSGAPLLSESPAVAALADHAESLSTSFAYVDPQAWRLHHDDQGTYDRSYEMTVHFDPSKIDAALVELGVTVWRGARPLLEPVILVRPLALPPYLLSAETSRGVELRSAAVRFAGEYGVGVRFPTEADLAAWGVSPFGFPAPLGAPDPMRAQVTGSLAWDFHARGWIGIWRLRFGSVEQGWQISGVGFDEAFSNMVRGAVMLVHGTGTP